MMFRDILNPAGEQDLMTLALLELSSDFEWFIQKKTDHASVKPEVRKIRCLIPVDKLSFVINHRACVFMCNGDRVYKINNNQCEAMLLQEKSNHKEVKLDYIFLRNGEEIFLLVLSLPFFLSLIYIYMCVCVCVSLDMPVLSVRAVVYADWTSAKT